MFLTARQLEQMLRETGAIALPFGAKLTPAAQDLVRARKLDVTYEVDAGKPRASVVPLVAPSTTLPYLWWSGVKSGTAKAALAMTAREANLREMAILDDATKATAAVRHLIAEVKAGTAAGGIVIVESSGLAALLANRSPHLRAIVGCSIATVDAGVRDVAANVLIIEPGTLPLMVLKNMIVRFVRGPRVASEELMQQLNEVSKP